MNLVYDGKVIGGITTNRSLTLEECFNLLNIDINEMDGDDPVWDYELFAMDYDAPAKVMINDRPVDFDAAVNLMDDEIREDLHADGITDKQEFVDAYCKRHLAKFGEEFRVD